MKAFAIRDASLRKDRDLAWLLYDPDSSRFTIEISDDVDEWEAPLVLSSFVKRGKRSVDPYWSMVWVEQRIVPRDRQNLGMILRDNGLQEYDPCRLLMLADGRCAQDDCFIVPLPQKRLPEELKARLSRRLSACLHEDSHTLLFFRDGMIRRITQEDLPLQEAQRKRLMHYQEAMRQAFASAGNSSASNSSEIDSSASDSSANDSKERSAEDTTIQVHEGSDSLLQLFTVQPCGSGLAFGDEYYICAEDLRGAGSLLPVTGSDFRAFVRQNVVDTASAAEILHCTRQNIQDLVRRKKLTPVKILKNNYLFLREDL